MEFNKDFMKQKINGWHFLLVIGTGCSILSSIILLGEYKVNMVLAVMPMLLWVGGYELCKKINIKKRRK